MNKIKLRASHLPLGLAVLALVIALAGCQTTTPPATNQSSADDTSQPAMIVGSDAIAVSSDGGTVTQVQFAVLSQSGFVVIHESNDQAKPGKIIGSSQLLAAGKTENFSVTSETLKAGQDYFAMLHFDNGDGIFDASSDPAVTDSGGNIVLMKYEVSGRGDAAREEDDDSLTEDEASAEADSEASADDSDEATESEVKTFYLDARNFSFSQTEIKVEKGDKVKIVLTSADGFHDWVIDGFNAATSRVNTGQTAETEFVADQAGTFEYYCSVGSHRQMGMVGKLIVE